MFDPSTFLVSPPDRTAALGGGGAAPAGFARPPFGGDVMSSAHTAGYRDVRWSNCTAPAPSPWARGTKRLGIAFEQRVIDVFEALYGRESFRASPVIEYRHGRKRHFAIPDGILRLDDTVIVIEVKLCHTVAVWPQLMERYAPLVRVLTPGAPLRTVEVCRSYDPAVNIPHTVIESLHRPGEGLEVLKWKI